MIFLDLFENYISFHTQAVKLDEKRSSVTIGAYKNKKALFEQYLKYRGLTSIRAMEVRMKLIDQYFDHLIRKGNKNDYSARCAEICRTVMAFGVRKDLIEMNPLSEFSIKKMPTKKPVYNTVRELAQIINYQPDQITLVKARVMYLSQCFMGFDYTDLTSVRKHHISDFRGKEYVIKKRNKTKVEATIPYFPEFEEIFRAHNYNLCLLSNGQYNLALKDLAKACDIEKEIHSHMGRKTFAMHKLNNEGYPLEVCSKMLGHASVKTTEKYYAQIELELVHNESLKHAN